MDFSLLGMWKSMGLPARLVVIVLAIMSVYSLSVMAERLFRAGRVERAARRAAEDGALVMAEGQQPLAAAEHDVHHETSDVNIRAIFGFATGLTIATVITASTTTYSAIV